MKKNYLILSIGLSLLMSSGLYAQQVSTFEDLKLNSESFWNGSDGTGQFTSGPAVFRNVYETNWGSWSGFAYSNITDNVTSGYENQYSAIAGKGAMSSSTYAVGYVFGADTVDLLGDAEVSGMYVTNSTYAALSMRDGSAFSKKFGGTDGTDPDWFKLTVEGWDANWTKTGTAEFYLADFRFDSSGEDYIVNTWQWLDLLNLGQASHLIFSLSSSDNGIFGMNTPAYFCIDNLTCNILGTKQVQFHVQSGCENVEGVTVAFNNEQLTTGLDGMVLFSSVSPTNSLPYEVSGRGYSTYRDTLDVYDNLLVEVELDKVPVDVKFVVDDGAQPLSGVTVNFAGLALATGVSGEVTFTSVSPTTSMDYELSKDGYQVATGNINAFKDETVQITLLPDAVNEQSRFSIALYPNPVDNQLTISADEEILDVEIFSISGIKLFKQANPGEKSMFINTYGWKTGIYIVKIKTGQRTEIYRISKE